MKNHRRCIEERPEAVYNLPLAWKKLAAFNPKVLLDISYGMTPDSRQRRNQDSQKDAVQPGYIRPSRKAQRDEDYNRSRNGELG